MAVQGSIGRTLEFFAATLPATYDEAGINGLTGGTLVGEIVTYGAFGGSGTIETHTPVDTGIVNKAVGVFDYGDMTLNIGEDLTDAGQSALKDAFDGANKRTVGTFIITEPDGTRKAFTGLVSSFETDSVSAGPFIAATCNIAINNQVLALAAAP